MALKFNFNIHAARQVQFHQGIYRLGRGFEDLQDPFMGPYLELLAGFFIYMRRPENGPPVDHRWQGNRSDDFGAGALGRLPTRPSGSFFPKTIVEIVLRLIYIRRS